MYKGLWPFLVGINLRIQRLGLANNGVYPAMSCYVCVFSRWSTMRFEGTVCGLAFSWQPTWLPSLNPTAVDDSQTVKPWISSDLPVPCFCIRGKHMVVQIKLLHFLVFAVLDGVYPCTWRSVISFTPKIYARTLDFHNTHTNLGLRGQVQAMVLIFPSSDLRLKIFWQHTELR